MYLRDVGNHVVQGLFLYLLSNNWQGVSWVNQWEEDEFRSNHLQKSSVIYCAPPRYSPQINQSLVIDGERTCLILIGRENGKPCVVVVKQGCVESLNFSHHHRYAVDFYVLYSV